MHVVLLYLDEGIPWGFSPHYWPRFQSCALYYIWWIKQVYLWNKTIWHTLNIAWWIFGGNRYWFFVDIFRKTLWYDVWFYGWMDAFLQKISHDRTENITRSHRKYHTIAQKIPHDRTENITRSHRKYHTIAQKISYNRTESITRSHRKYHTIAQKISYNRTESITRSHRKYRKILRKISHNFTWLESLKIPVAYNTYIIPHLHAQSKCRSGRTVVISWVWSDIQTLKCQSLNEKHHIASMCGKYAITFCCDPSKKERNVQIICAFA